MRFMYLAFDTALNGSFYLGGCGDILRRIKFFEHGEDLFLQKMRGVCWRLVGNEKLPHFVIRIYYLSKILFQSFSYLLKLCTDCKKKFI